MSGMLAFCFHIYQTGITEILTVQSSCVLVNSDANLMKTDKVCLPCVDTDRVWHSVVPGSAEISKHCWNICNN